MSCYSVFNLEQKKFNWTVEDVERLMFKADDFNEDKWYIFGEPELNNEGESAHIEDPDEVWAVKKKLENRPVSDSKEKEFEKTKTTKKKEATESRQYFRTYNIKFGEKDVAYDDEQLVFEGYVVVQDNTKVTKKDKKRKKE